MESKYQYRLSQKAEADLDGIVSYIAVELSNPQAASDFVDKLGKVIDEYVLFRRAVLMSTMSFFPIRRYERS